MVKNIAMIGAGSMSEAIIAGLVKQKLIPSKNIQVMNKSNTERLKYLQKTYSISNVEQETSSLSKADVVILSAKPKDIPAAIQSIKPQLSEEQLIISVAAGVSTDTIQEEIGFHIPVIRSMPNTSATIGYSATAIAKGTYATNKHADMAKRLFDTIGITVEVAEQNIDIVTGISGSGPAYIYYFVEALEAEAVTLGLDSDTAQALITQTIIGAGQMLAQSDKTAKTLRENVTSPNGTTEAGIHTLASFDFQSAIRSCVRSAVNRATELGKK